MSYSQIIKSARLRFSLLALISLFWLISGSAFQAVAVTISPAISGVEARLPEKYGEIIYQSNAAAPWKLFIIANGHRSAISGAFAANTLQAQVETYRIGEWLITHNQIELLLPEGFFGDRGGTGTLGFDKGQLDSQSLRDALAETALFVNAELLLHRNFGIGLAQIEDRELYYQARELLGSSLKPENRLSPSFRSEINYLTKLRSANLLKDVPVVIQSAFQQGRISSPKAMLTIGLSHLDDLITFLEAGEIDIAALHTTAKDYPAKQNELALFQEQVSVTVIVPRTLVSCLVNSIH